MAQSLCGTVFRMRVEAACYAKKIRATAGRLTVLYSARGGLVIERPHLCVIARDECASLGTNPSHSTKRQGALQYTVQEILFCKTDRHVTLAKHWIMGAAAMCVYLKLVESMPDLAFCLQRQ